MAHHDGVEQRPATEYFGSRGHLVSQGDIFEDVPLAVSPGGPEDALQITSEEAMVLTASCMIDHRADELQVAPVITIDRLGFGDGLMNEIREYDCHHRVMYLPMEGGKPERAVRLDKAQPISRHILESCDRQSQLTAEATRHLMRKITLYSTGNHFPRDKFALAPDDFAPDD
jgi:hypothetical protein